MPKSTSNVWTLYSNTKVIVIMVTIVNILEVSVLMLRCQVLFLLVLNMQVRYRCICQN